MVAALLVADSLLPGHRRATRHPQAFAWLWTGVLVLAASGFAAWIAVAKGHQPALEFVAGYAIETSPRASRYYSALTGSPGSSA